MSDFFVCRRLLSKFSLQLLHSRRKCRPRSTDLTQQHANNKFMVHARNEYVWQWHHVLYCIQWVDSTWSLCYYYCCLFIYFQIEIGGRIPWRQRECIPTSRFAAEGLRHETSSELQRSVNSMVSLINHPAEVIRNDHSSFWSVKIHSAVWLLI